jgi:hypothetical protein
MVILAELKIAGRENTGIVCPNPLCSAEISQKFWDKTINKNSNYIICPNCSKEELKKGIKPRNLSFNINESPIKVSYESRMLLNKNYALSNTWYHATTSKQWYENILEASKIKKSYLFIHLGSKKAALDRAQINFKNTPYYLYSINLLPRTKIAEHIMDDYATFWPEYVIEVENSARPEKIEFENANAFRYINRYEDPGSVSILTTPNMIKIEAQQIIKNDKTSCMTAPKR